MNDVGKKLIFYQKYNDSQFIEYLFKNLEYYESHKDLFRLVTLYFL